ncbi:serine protease [Streptomyces sp. NPDC047108]|uniref:serine protease n=1 Tax=Streptomyces sp. NPDC047108 TaxID=3155025 RepID=UPI0033E038F0
MNKPLVGALAAVFLAAAAAPAGALTATEKPAEPTRQIRTAPAETSGTAGKAARAADFAGTVALSNCSGSVVRMPDSQDQDPALVLSNGHCLESGMPGAGDVVVDKPSSRTFDLLNAEGDEVASLKATKVAYATMTDTDISLYELDTTYADIESEHGIKALEMSADHPEQGKAIDVVSGYWKRVYSCEIDGFVHEMREADWTWKDSVRYTPACDTIGGTSGSPVVDSASGKVVAVNNTGNESGGECTMNNPCEVDENGKVTVREGISYAQQTYTLTKCIGTGNKVDLGLPGCELPKPE